MDSQTELLTRSGFLEALEAEILKRDREGSTLALLVLNINQFRTINTVYGYAGGDQLLVEIANRIQRVKRTSDIAGRIGSDEFAIILPNLGSPHIAELAANKIIQSVKAHTALAKQTISIKANIGISVLTEPGVSAEELVLQADSAMQLARDTHRDYRTVDCIHQKLITARRVLECDLGDAIKDGEMELHYQPKVNLETHKLSGAEALVRWNHPEYGMIRPDEFISIAEESLLILPLTVWTLNTALRQSIESRKLWPDFKVAVNLSASILDDELVELVMRALRTWDVPPEQLILEVTENAVMKNPESCLNTLNKLRDEGIELSLDDFGTGYSSFSYLKRLPVQELKIDQSFVKLMMDSEDDIHIVQAMIDLGKNFGLRVIAEGIETPETVDRLVDLGCHSGQGYYIARPMPHAMMLDWIRNSAWTSGTDAQQSEATPQTAISCK